MLTKRGRVRVIEHAGAPMILVGTNIPGLAPLEDGTGAVLSYRHEGNGWVRDVVMENPDPTVTNYNAMIVVTSDIDQILNGSRDLVLAIDDVGITGDYHVVAAPYMEGSGVFQPAPGIDYMAASDRRTFGQGQVEVTLDLELIPSTAGEATDPALPALHHRSGRRMQ